MPDTFLKPLPTTNRVALPSSSLAHVAYDRYREILQVEFRDGTVYPHDALRSTHSTRFQPNHFYRLALMGPCPAGGS